MSDEFLTVAEIGESLKVNPQTVYNWIERGRLRSVRVGARRGRVRRADLDAFLAGQSPEPAVTVAAPPRAQPSGESAQDQFLGALTEILRNAVHGDAHERASALRELASAAEALAETLDRESRRGPDE